MVPRGWYKQYEKILQDFGFSKKEDRKAAKILDTIIKRPLRESVLSKMISEKPVFVFGAGPSLSHSANYIAKHFERFKVTTIAADGAAGALLENNIIPDIVVTDLDGDKDALLKASRSGAIMVVHAHGDNKDTLQMAADFKRCIGTTQSRPQGDIRNFGGFTDGDRCVFLADHFGASEIVLFGMDFGTKVGTYSKKIEDKPLKIKKLKRAKMLLEWLASKRDTKFYTTSAEITGFKKTSLKELDDII